MIPYTPWDLIRMIFRGLFSAEARKQRKLDALQRELNDVVREIKRNGSAVRK